MHSASALSVNDVHHRRRITLADNGTLGQSLFDSVEILLADFDINRSHIFFQASNAARPRNRDNIVVTTNEPCQCQLSGRAFLFCREFAQAVRNSKIHAKLFALEPRITSPPVLRREVVNAAKSSSEETATQRTVSDECDAKFPQCFEQAFLWLTAEQRVFRLYGMNRMHLVRTAHRCGRGFRQPQVAHLASAHQFGHPAYSFFNRDL